MAGGFNRVTLIGNLGDEPQVRPSQSGTSVATITLAINEYRRDQNGNKTESTEWVRVVAFGKNAEIIGQYLHKGSQVHIEGKLRTRSYDDKDGNKRYITEVVCDPAGLLMLGSKAPREDSYDMPQSNSSFKPQQQSNAYASNQNGNHGQYGQNNSHGFQINQNPQTAMFNQN
ncbi:single-stranded DNA-binding protein, partial [Succinivibrio sp.]|uniref:single-stranded DNA-binding protein n=1 Tax=Succinivibrio sp. TaxID=2053619 RepID=UPI00386BB26D